MAVASLFILTSCYLSPRQSGFLMTCLYISIDLMPKTPTTILDDMHSTDVLRTAIISLFIKLIANLTMRYFFLLRCYSHWQ